MSEQYYVISGAWKGRLVRELADSELHSEKWKDFVLVSTLNFQGQQLVRRMEKDNLMPVKRFRFKPGDKVLVKDEVGGPAGRIVRNSKSVDEQGNRTNTYTINWGTDANKEEVNYTEDQLEFAPRTEKNN